MKPFRLLHLLRHLSEKAVCPACKSVFYPENILVFGSTDTTAILSVFCQRCDEYLFAHAFFQGADETAFSRQHSLTADLTAAEVDAAVDVLRRHRGNISDLFSENHASS